MGTPQFECSSEHRDKLHQLVISFRKQGKTFQVIGDYFGFSKERARQIFHYGPGKKSRARSLKDKEKAKVWKLANEKRKSVQQLSKELGTSYAIIRGVLLEGIHAIDPDYTGRIDAWITAHSSSLEPSASD